MSLRNPQIKNQLYIFPELLADKVENKPHAARFFSYLAGIIELDPFTHENVVVVEVVRYISIVFNAFWGFAFWFEIPDIYVIIGGGLIVFGCIALSYAKNIKK